MKTFFKNLLFRPGLKPRRVIAGPLQGLTFLLDPSKQSQFILGLYECETNPRLKQFGGSCGTFIDIGSGDGELVVWALRKTQASRILAIEIDDTRNRTLLENLALNNLSQDGGGKLEIINVPVETEGADHANTLEKITTGLEEPIFLKIDIDGPEAELLNASHHFLKIRKVNLLVETHSREIESSLIECFRDLGYQVDIIPNAWWRFLLPERRPVEHNRWLAAWK